MELIREEGRIYGSRYYTVKPVVSWDLDGDWGGIDTWNEMFKWMITTFGPTPKDGVWTPNCRWYANNSKFWFREQKDLEWFVLKWQ